jgi:VirE N-terminal domain
MPNVSLFRGTTNAQPVGILTLGEVLDTIQSDAYQRPVQRLRELLRTQGQAAYDVAKRLLPAVTLAGIFSPRRAKANLVMHSGIVHGDLDHLNDAEGVKQRLAADPYVVYIFISPSGTGLKVGVHVTLVGNDVAYKRAWQAVADAHRQQYGLTWDPSGKDVSRLCYVSWDPALCRNLDAHRFPVPDPAPRPAARPLQRPGARLDTRYYGYGERAVRTAVQMIEDARPGTRHHTRLRASRLLGGFVAGGLLTAEQAYGALAQALVGHTEDLERALKTVEDGLRYGQTNPITLEALEAERQDWLAAHRPLSGMAGDVPPKDDPWGGLPTLPLCPYTGYRGYGRGVRHG